MASISAVIAGQKAAKMKKSTSQKESEAQKQREQEELREQWPLVRKTCYHFIHNHTFEATCGLIILFNMFLVIIETDYGAKSSDPPDWVGQVTHVLLVIYTTELAVKLYVYRLDFFHDMWNILDFAIVGVDIILLIIGFITPMPSVAILRVFRLIRLARAFKAANFFRELHALIRSFTCAMKAIFWGILMIVMTLTVWSILAVQLIHPVNERVVEKHPQVYDGCERCHRAFASVFESALTFFQQLVAGDSWGMVSHPIIEEAPWTSILFLMVLVTVNLTMLNLILAVIVEAGAAAAAEDEHDRAMQVHLKVVKAEAKLIELCQTLDTDNSGALTMTEFKEGFHNNLEFRECLEIMHVTEDDMGMIFNICDEDFSGDVNYHEFVEQLRRIKNSGEQMLLHYVTDIRHGMQRILREVQQKGPGRSPDKLASGAANDASDGGSTTRGESSARNSDDRGRSSPVRPMIKEALLKKELTDEKLQAAQNIVDALKADALDRLESVLNSVAQESREQKGLLRVLVSGLAIPPPESVNDSPLLTPPIGAGTSQQHRLATLLTVQNDPANAPSDGSLLCASNRAGSGWCLPTSGPRVAAAVI